MPYLERVSTGERVTLYQTGTSQVVAQGIARLPLQYGVWEEVKFGWDVEGQQTSLAVPLPATTGLSFSHDGSTPGATSLGKVPSEGVTFWVKATERRAEANREQRVIGMLYGAGEDAPSSPVFTSGPTISNVSSTAATLSATFSDPDVGDSVTAKYILRTVDETPTEEEWAGAGVSGNIVARATFVNPVQMTSLTPGSYYKAWVRIVDSTGRHVVQAATEFITSNASNQPPTIASLSSSVTSQSLSMSGLISDPEGDTIVTKRYIVTNTNSAPSQAEIDGSAGGRVIAVGNFTSSPTVVTGLTQITTLYWWLYAADSLHPNLAGGATLSAMQTATTATLGAPTLTSATTTFTSLSLDWSDVSGANGYDVEYGTTNAYGTAVDPDPTSSTTTITGLSAGTLYYYRVRAHDSAGNVGSWLTGTATATAAFTNDFAAGESLNSAYLGTSVSGSGSVTTSSNRLVLNSQTTAGGTDAALVYVKSPIPEDQNCRYVVRSTLDARNHDANDATQLFAVWHQSPAVGVSTTVNAYRDIYVNHSNNNGTPLMTATYITNTGATKVWDWSGNAWADPTPAVYYGLLALGTYATVEMEVNTLSQWRLVIKDQAGSVLETTSWVNWSATQGSAGSHYVCSGEQYTNGYGCQQYTTLIKLETY